ncbi:MAG: hypothetical protein V4585_06050 [Bacteroidota bacterium]
MKTLFIFTLFFIRHQVIQAQKITFKALNDPKNHAGCYVESGGKTIANLSEEDSLGRPIAIFNLSGKDENFHEIKGFKKYAAGYTNGDIKIFIKQTTTRKEPNTCLEYQLYKMILVVKKKTYFYTFKGFCGC